MTRKRDAGALRFFEVPGAYGVAAFLLAGLLTVLTFHGLNVALDRWVDRELDQGIQIKVAQGQSIEEARFEVLHAMAPAIFEWRQPLTAINHAKFLEERFEASLSGERFSRSSLERVIVSVAQHACWAGNQETCRSLGETGDASPAVPSHLRYLRFLSFRPQAERISDLQRRLEGYELHPGLSLLGLRKAVEPAPFAGRIFRVKRDEPMQERARLETLESFLDGLTARLAHEAWLPRRLILMLNGEIQWLTLFTGLWCLFLLVWRWRRARKGRWQVAAFRRDGDMTRSSLPALWIDEGRALVGSGLPEPEARAELASRYERALEVRHYSAIDWLILIVPMLGFIGTIVGMTLAMGNAGQVVAAESQTDLQRAMSNLTGYLGTAFDTTLVALVLSILLEGVRRSVARREFQLVEHLRPIRFDSSEGASDEAAQPRPVAQAGGG
ncbi:MAG TPA: MotA/TolQ/ExbB proton channel family protein [Thermoanaerobaculia bacterium]|nr:MotA/TolQ/ExbB proton channel family protein [Thermoanaerobaculia bacterium]